MKLAALSMILAILVAGCTSTGQTTQPVEEPDTIRPIEPVAEAPAQPAANPSTDPSASKCTDSAGCPAGMSCLKNICVKIQFVK